MGSRRKARIKALQALFEIDAVGHDVGEVVERNLEEDQLAEETALFFRELVHGVIENREKIDKVIGVYAPAWPVDQLALIDKNVLRLAIFEILFDNKVPIKVIINEAVDLAKSFGGDGSPKFVNGVLGTVSAQTDKERR